MVINYLWWRCFSNHKDSIPLIRAPWLNKRIKEWTSGVGIRISHLNMKQRLQKELEGNECWPLHMQIRSLRMISLEVCATWFSSLTDKQTGKGWPQPKGPTSITLSCTHCWRKQVLILTLATYTTAPRRTTGSATPSGMWQMLKYKLAWIRLEQI